tara:strand:+ start:265 stop:651 length:387 start_codon:yes stop_codon:yes gene_type:complete
MSFSFAQNNIKQNINDRAALKKNTIEVVNFLSKSLELDSKQKAIVMNSYSEYANAISKATEKTKKIQGKSPTMASKKQMQAYVLRFTEKRNKDITACLKKKQIKQFNEIQQRIHPVTLEIKKEKKKKK